jgi:hypothetical protein
MKVDDFETGVTCEEYYMEPETQLSKELHEILDRMDAAITKAQEHVDSAMKHIDNAERIMSNPSLENDDGSSKTNRL